MAERMSSAGWSWALAVLRSNIELIGKGSARLAERLREGADATAQIERLAALIESSSATMHDAMQRIADIARSFGRFSRLDQAERQAFDVREGLESAISLLEPTVSRDIRWQRRFDDDLPRVAAWPRELNHAFFTVLRNAAEAIEGEGHVTVEARAGDGEVIVRVADSGRGMDETLAQALFDVAWSHSGDRTSMRLGLSAAYATMQKHGGAIEVDSREREGTTVTFRLPIV